MGALQRRLGRRVNQLMTGGNRYEGSRSRNRRNGLSVILRETVQAPALRHVVSFPAQVSEPHRPNPITERDQYVSPPNDEPDQVPVDATDSDDAMDPAEAAVLDIPDDTAVESVGIDDVPNVGRRRRCDRLVAYNAGLRRRRGMELVAPLSGVRGITLVPRLERENLG